KGLRPGGCRTAAPCQEPEILVQALCDLAVTQDADPSCCELQCQWKAVKPSANLDYRARVLGRELEPALDRPCALHKEPYRGGSTNLAEVECRSQVWDSQGRHSPHDFAI